MHTLIENIEKCCIVIDVLMFKPFCVLFSVLCSGCVYQWLVGLLFGRTIYHVTTTLPLTINTLLNFSGCRGSQFKILDVLQWFGVCGQMEDIDSFQPVEAIFPHCLTKLPESCCKFTFYFVLSSLLFSSSFITFDSPASCFFVTQVFGYSLVLCPLCVCLQYMYINRCIYFKVMIKHKLEVKLLKGMIFFSNVGLS